MAQDDAKARALQKRLDDLHATIDRLYPVELGHGAGEPEPDGVEVDRANVPSLEEHPFMHFLRAGYRLTLNPDRRSIFDFYTVDGAVALQRYLRTWEGGRLVVHTNSNARLL